ncbi:MAG TPA: cytochrome c [Terriglobales bacterium]|nr:cytochrome c [Terriglobales bacterium]
MQRGWGESWGNCSERSSRSRGCWNSRRLSRLAAIFLLAPSLTAYSVADSGADIYKAKCAACHAANGQGDTMLGKNLKVRPLTSPETQQQSDEELFAIIAKGKNRMPPFEHKLSREQIHEVLRFVRSLSPPK